MKLSLIIFTMFFSFELYANDTVKALRTHPDLDGAIIHYCLIAKKSCGKVDRSRSNFTLLQVIDNMPKLAKALDDIKPGLESFETTYKIADLPGQESSFDYSYVRPKSK
jgi:hypothetical protein